MKHLHRNKHTKNGVTLVELLVVVTILMMLAAFAIPAVRPMTEGRRIREAARAIDVFLTRAKIRAVEIQRPVGVEFQRMTEIDFGDPYDATDDTILLDQDDACNTLRVVEIPAPYGGNYSNSRVRVQNWTYFGGSYYHIHRHHRPPSGRSQGHHPKWRFLRQPHSQRRHHPIQPPGTLLRDLRRSQRQSTASHQC